MFRIKDILAGSAVGAVNGLLGGGGGMIAVPALTAAGLDVRRAHASAIAVVLPASIVSAVVYIVYGLLPLSYFVPVAAGTVLGGILGANVLKSAPPRAVTVIFAALMLAAGLKAVLA